MGRFKRFIMFKLAQKKKEEQDKREQEAKHGYSKQMSIRSKLLTQGKHDFILRISLRYFPYIIGNRSCRASTRAS